MKVFKIIVVGVVAGLLWASCFNSRWSEEQRNDFETNCSQTDTFTNLLFQLNGFENNEFDSILIRDYIDGIIVDSFKVFVWPAQNPNEKERKERSATIKKTMHIKHKYQFIIPGEKPYELTNMKMIMWPQYTMTSEGWGCVMGDFTIDGVRFEHTSNPIFIKRNTSSAE